jgi:hypothetical protein
MKYFRVPTEDFVDNEYLQSVLPPESDMNVQAEPWRDSDPDNFDYYDYWDFEETDPEIEFIVLASPNGYWTTGIYSSSNPLDPKGSEELKKMLAKLQTA